MIPLAGLVSPLLRRSRVAGILAVIDAALLFLTTPADQAVFFFTAPPPPAFTAGEYVLIFVGIRYMLYGPQVYAKTRSHACEKQKREES
ncbi:MAG: hypothetical protein ACE14P_06340 [Methanotrichaceae archaeon]